VGGYGVGHDVGIVGDEEEQSQSTSSTTCSAPTAVTPTVVASTPTEKHRQRNTQRTTIYSEKYLLGKEGCPVR